MNNTSTGALMMIQSPTQIYDPGGRSRALKPRSIALYVCVTDEEHDHSVSSTPWRDVIFLTSDGVTTARFQRRSTGYQHMNCFKAIT